MAPRDQSAPKGLAEDWTATAPKSGTAKLDPVPGSVGTEEPEDPPPPQAMSANATKAAAPCVPKALNLKVLKFTLIFITIMCG